MQRSQGARAGLLGLALLRGRFGFLHVYLVERGTHDALLAAGGRYAERQRHHAAASEG